jgi:hypothetical protein
VIAICATMAVIALLLKPEGPPDPNAPRPVQTTQQMDPAINPATPYEADSVKPISGPGILHKQMTNEQTLRYWQFFNIMMEQGQADIPRHFPDKTFTTAYVVSDMVPTERGIICRSFTERLELADQKESHFGTACRIGREEWCRKFQGESTPTCRRPPPSGLDALMLDGERKFRDLNVQLNSAISAW